ncbi:MAG TPA: MlaD family protein [Edaphocola sp.]|nr:MlaD family protein [Edaphocola sp.]
MARSTKGNQIKIGILTLVSIAALFIGINFLKGKSVFSREKSYVTFFDDVSGMTTATKIKVNGYQVGKVATIDMIPDGRFKITLNVEKDFKVPQGSTLTTVTADLLSGAKDLTFVLGNSSIETKSGDTLQSNVSLGLLDGISKGVPEVMDNLNSVTNNADTLVNNLKGVVDDNTGKHINQILISLELAMKQIEVLSQNLAHESKNISSIVNGANNSVANINRLTSNLNDGKIDRILGNSEILSQQLVDSKLQETISNLEITTKKLNTVIAKLDQKDGSLGLLINDQNLYINLNKSASELGSLLEDIKNHPSKYINISVLPSKSRN